MLQIYQCTQGNRIASNWWNWPKQKLTGLPNMFLILDYLTYHALVNKHITFILWTNLYCKETISVNI